MKGNGWALLSACSALIVIVSANAAVTKTNWPDAPAMSYVFVENNADDNFL